MVLLIIDECLLLGLIEVVARNLSELIYKRREKSSMIYKTGIKSIVQPKNLSIKKAYDLDATKSKK